MAAINGSKFRASNSHRRNFTKNKVNKMISHHEETARKYTESVDVKLVKLAKDLGGKVQ